MGWLVPSIVASLAGGVILASVFTYLAVTGRERFMRHWAVAWALFVVRLVFDLVDVLVPGGSHLAVLLSHAAGIAYGLLLLAGTTLFLGQRLPRGALVVAGVSGFVLTAVASWLGAPASLESVPSYAIQGVAHIVTGVAWWQSRSAIGPWPRVTAVVFLAGGLHKLDYPLLRYLPAIAPVGFMLSAGLSFTIAVAVLVSYFESTRQLLESSEARYRALFEDSASVMLVIDPAGGRIVDANLSAERYYGWSRDELRSMRIGDINTLAPDEIAAEMAAARESRRTFFQFRHRLASGDVRDVEVFSGPVIGEAGELLYSIVHDVTMRVEAERALSVYQRELEDQVEARTTELQALNRELEAANRAKDDFLTSMSHELRTPLNSVIGFAHILRQEMPGPLNAEQARQVAMIERAGQHLLALVNDILDLSRIESGAVHVHLAPLDIAALAAEVAEAGTPMADERGLSVLVEAESVPMVTTDAHLVEQILWNLIGNAIKYTDGGQVAVKVNSPNGHVTVSVTDTGPGMTPAELERAFERFGRLRGPGGAGGTGLGLSIARSLAEHLGGELVVSSTPGIGSTFAFRLPLEAPAEPGA